MRERRGGRYQPNTASNEEKHTAFITDLNEAVNSTKKRWNYKNPDSWWLYQKNGIWVHTKPTAYEYPSEHHAWDSHRDIELPKGLPMGEIKYHVKNNTKPGDESFSEKRENMIKAARGLSEFFTQIDKRHRKLFPKMVPSVLYTRAVTKEGAVFAEKRLGFHVTRDDSFGTYMMAPTDTVRQKFEELKPRIERIEQYSNKKVIAQPVKR